MSKAKLTPREKGLAKKAENEEKALQNQKELEEKKLAQEWSKGAKDNSKVKEKEDKEAEKLRLKAEKLALEQADAEEAARVGRIKVTTAPANGGGGAAAKTKKQKDDAKLLAAALAEIPKSKADKEAEKKAKEAEEKKKLEEKKRAEKEEAQKKKEEELAKLKAKGIVVDASEELMIEVKKENRAVGSDIAIGSDGQIIDSVTATSLDDALLLSIFGSAEAASKEQQTLKSLYRAFCEEEMPKLKMEFPGLRMTQYRQKVYDLWKHSPQNPLFNKGKLPDRDWWKYELEEDE